jgi:hypothetical protein
MELVEYIKPEDRETYDYIFMSAKELTGRYDKETLLHQVGVLLFTIINQWEKGLVRDISTISMALSVAQAYHSFLSWELENFSQELEDKVRALINDTDQGA